jgi:hypothetical protein
LSNGGRQQHATVIVPLVLRVVEGLVGMTVIIVLHACHRVGTLRLGIFGCQSSDW